MDGLANSVSTSDPKVWIETHAAHRALRTSVTPFWSLRIFRFVSSRRPYASFGCSRPAYESIRQPTRNSSDWPSLSARRSGEQ